MAKLQKRQKREFQTNIPVRKFAGKNLHALHSDLIPAEFRQLDDLEIYAGDPDYLESRRGSQYLRPATPDRWPSDTIDAGVTWDIGAEEYAVCQVGQNFYYQALLTPGNPTEIKQFDGTTEFKVDAATAADMFLDEDRILVFHSSGNRIIEWDSVASKFKGRDMGMKRVYFNAINTATAGNVSGQYVYAIEKCYQVNDGDILCSGPNRLMEAGSASAAKEYVRTGTITDKKPLLNVSNTDLSTDTLWTHLKIYRSKNLLPDLTDVDAPVEPGGTEDDMWHLATITKAETAAVGLTAIATGANYVLPPGNKNIRCGTVGGIIQVEDDNTDDSLINLVTPDVLELLPMPPADLGVYHAERVWASAVSDGTWDNGIKLNDASRNNVYYSPNNVLWYKEQSSTTKFLETNKDGQVMKKLISFERDLVAIKEDKTLRLPDGDVTLGFETTDHSQGVTHKNFALFVPELGVCGITSDYKDFKIYGFDHVWRSTLNGIEISKSNRAVTEALGGSDTSMAHINGKLMISAGGGTVHVLNVEQKRGWSRFIYPNDRMDRIFVFGGGTRGVAIGQNEYAVEFDVKDLNTDIDTDTENAADIQPIWDTFMFRSGDGAHVLEHEYLSIMAKLSDDMTGIGFVNNQEWPTAGTEKKTLFYPSPNVDATSSLKVREYRLYIQPEAQGVFKWNRMIGNWLNYKMQTKAPCVIKTHDLFCIVDEDGNAFAGIDPFQTRLINPSAPAWSGLDNAFDETGTAADTIDETGSAPDTITEES